MKVEKTGVVMYQCALSEEAVDNCEAITEIVSYAELQRGLRMYNKKI